jgi:hypothetical protein
VPDDMADVGGGDEVYWCAALGDELDEFLGGQDVGGSEGGLVTDGVDEGCSGDDGVDGGAEGYPGGVW